MPTVPEPVAPVELPPPVTVMVKEACGVELPAESWARQETVWEPTVNWLPEERLQTRLYGGVPPETENEYETCAQ